MILPKAGDAIHKAWLYRVLSKEVFYVLMSHIRHLFPTNMSRTALLKLTGFYIAKRFRLCLQINLSQPLSDMKNSDQ